MFVETTFRITPCPIFFPLGFCILGKSIDCTSTLFCPRKITPRFSAITFGLLYPVPVLVDPLNSAQESVADLLFGEQLLTPASRVHRPGHYEHSGRARKPHDAIEVV